MLIYKLKYQVILLLLLLALSGNTQTVQDAYLNSDISERQINRDNWKETIDGISYVEEEEEEEEEEVDQNTPPPSSPRSSQTNSRGGGNSGAFVGNLFKVILALIVIAAIVLLVANVMGVGKFVSPANRKIRKTDDEITIENIEDHIYETDLQRFIREAVEGKNYALAVRIYYLAIIKELSLNRTIKWKKDKTNKDYLREMRKTNMFQSFREATRIFERVWYGEGALEYEDFQDIKPKFEALVKAAQSR